MVNLLSVNGTLQSLYDPVKVESEQGVGRANPYKSIELGSPIVVRYLHFYLKYDSNEDKNQIMISTYVKTEEEKQAAAEAINYFNPEVVFPNGAFRLVDFGGKNYGHELIYYSKSFLGETIRLTTKIMELDQIDQELVNNINDTVSKIGDLPAFAEFLPGMAMAKKTVSIFAQIWNIFDRDDPIIYDNELDLHFNRNNARILQSGRIVCIPEEDESSEETIAEKYELTKDNRLVDKNSKNEYTEKTYFVLQVDSKKHSLYEKFDYFQHAADLLKKTNRGGSTEVLQSITSILEGYNDVSAIREIEDLSIDVDDENSRKKIRALYKSMSPDLKKVYQDRLKEIILQPEDS